MHALVPDQSRLDFGWLDLVSTDLRLVVVPSQELDSASDRYLPKVSRPA
jgi:hypothetical protein